MKASLDDPLVVAELCKRIAQGLAIARVCEANDMPAESTVYARMATDETFRSNIARAREAQQDYEVERCIEIADEATPDDVHVAKLRIWARQWRAGKLAPKKYGDAVNLKHSDPDGGPVKFETRSAEELAREILFDVAKPQKKD